MNAEYISTLSQYIGVIELLRSFYPSRPILNNPVSTLFLYRGICNENFELLPSVFRKQIDVIDGHDISNSTYRAWSNEKDLLLSFIHEASGFLSIPPSDLGHWAEYAQHYGVPTRFLDYTNNPLTALYFACRDNAEKDGAVWLLHLLNYKRFLAKQLHIPDDKIIRDIISELINQESDIEYPIVYTPYYVDPRMSAQGSYFMVWGKRELSLDNILQDDCYHMACPKNDNGIRTYGKEQEKAILFKFQIHADGKQHLLRELDMVGINEKTLFPGLDGIGRYVERKYRFNYYEAVSCD